MGPAEGQPAPPAGAAGPSSLGSRLPPTPLRGRRVLIIRGKAQVPVSPPAFSLLFLLVLQGPLPGQAVGDRGSAQPQADAQSIPLASIVGRGRRAGLHPAHPLELGSTRLGVLHPRCNRGPPARASPRPHCNGGPPARAPPRPHCNGGPPVRAPLRPHCNGGPPVRAPLRPHCNGGPPCLGSQGRGRVVTARPEGGR